LTITDVRVKTIDDSAHYLYPNRTIEIKTSGRSILTPMRAATSYEYHEKAKVPTDIPINNPIVIDVEKLDSSRFEKLLTTNHYFGKLMRKLDLNNRLAQHADLRLTLLQPTVTPKKDVKTGAKLQDSPMNILKQDHALREKFIRFIIRLHQEAGLSPITIPFVELPFHTFQEVVRQINRSLERLNEQPVFFVDLNYTNFEQAIDFLANEIQSKMIGLIFRRFRQYPLSYDTLSKYVDKDIAFLAAQVYRYDPYYDDISAMHYLPFFGNDIYAVEIPTPFSSSAKGDHIRPPQDRLKYIRFYDEKSLQVSPLASRESVIDRLASEFRSDAIISSILQHYREARTDDSKYKVLNAFSKVNELNTSSLEFERLQNYIKQSSTKEYVEEKKVLQDTLNKVRQEAPNSLSSKQTRLA